MTNIIEFKGTQRSLFHCQSLNNEQSENRMMKDQANKWNENKLRYRTSVYTNQKAFARTFTGCVVVMRCSCLCTHFKINSEVYLMGNNMTTHHSAIFFTLFISASRISRGSDFFFLFEEISMEIKWKYCPMFSVCSHSEIKLLNFELFSQITKINSPNFWAG